MHRNNVADTPTLYRYGDIDLLCHYTLSLYEQVKLNPRLASDKVLMIFRVYLFLFSRFFLYFL